MGSDDNLKIFCITFCILGYVFYKLKKKYNYWENLNIPYVGFPQDFFFSFRTHRCSFVNDVYKKLAPSLVGGFFEAATPVLVIRNPEIVQSILVKDFSSFVNRPQSINEELDPLRAHIVNLRGQRWKMIRQKLTPAFSSGKIRSMFLLLDDCTEVLEEHIDQILEKSTEIEVQVLMNKFAAQVIGICAFGLDCNTIKDENSDFQQILKKMASKKFQSFLTVLFNTINPKIMKWLRWKEMDIEVEQFFLSLTREAIENGTAYGLKRNDFMQHLINVQHEEQKLLQSKNDKSEPMFTENVVAANVYSFFTSGFSTTASTLSYCLYELALHPEMMDKLYTEIRKQEESCGGKLDYAALREMTYMEQIISETLRKNPIGGTLLRTCNSDYRIPNSSLVIRNGTVITIPVYALHHDPEYFPDPEKFDPERFNAENKSKITPGSYLPFCDGPRACIAQRFALVVIKSALANIIRNYTVHPTEKTEIPIKWKIGNFINAPSKIYLKFQKRLHADL